MGKCEKLWVNNGLKESWFHKIIFFPFTGIRCQENGERGALVLAPSSTSWSLVREAIAGWAAGPAQPAYPYPDLPSVSLAGPPSGLTTHRLSAHILYTGGAPASLSSLLMGSPPISGPSLPNSLAGALRPGLAESSPWAVRIVCLLLRGSSGPLVFSQKPWSLGPSCGCRGRHSSCPFSLGDPSGLGCCP